MLCKLKYVQKEKQLLDKVETYTYANDKENRPIEVLLIGVNAPEIGSENTFEPPGFNREHITTWLRQRYFFLEGCVFSQVPRRLQDFPEPVREQFNYNGVFASDVTIESESVQVHYPVSDTQSVCLEWNVGVDHWSMSEVTQPSEDGKILPERGYAADSQRFWSSP